VGPGDGKMYTRQDPSSSLYPEIAEYSRILVLQIYQEVSITVFQNAPEEASRV
jgi:hypothetical protein